MSLKTAGKVVTVLLFLWIAGWWIVLTFWGG